MFNEDEDWNDEEEAQVPSETVVTRNLKSNSSKHVKVSIFLFKKKTICMSSFSVDGSKSLFTLYTYY